MRDRRNVTAIGATVLTLAGLAFLLAGCHARPPMQATATNLSQAEVGVAGIAEAAHDAKTHVAAAVPHSDDVGKTELHSATASLDRVDLHTGETDRALAALTASLARVQTQIDKLQADYTTLYNRWYCVLGRWSESLFWFLLLGWLLLGIVGVVASVAFPGTLVATLAAQIFHLLPVMNPFGWIVSFWTNSHANPVASS